MMPDPNVAVIAMKELQSIFSKLSDNKTIYDIEWNNGEPHLVVTFAKTENKEILTLQTALIDQLANSLVDNAYEKLVNARELIADEEKEANKIPKPSKHDMNVR